MLLKGPSIDRVACLIHNRIQLIKLSLCPIKVLLILIVGSLQKQKIIKNLIIYLCKTDLSYCLDVLDRKQQHLAHCYSDGINSE